MDCTFFCNQNLVCDDCSLKSFIQGLFFQAHSYIYLNKTNFTEVGGWEEYGEQEGTGQSASSERAAQECRCGGAGTEWVGCSEDWAKGEELGDQWGKVQASVRGSTRALGKL